MSDTTIDRGDEIVTPAPVESTPAPTPDPAPTPEPTPEPSPEDKKDEVKQDDAPRDDKGRFIPKSRVDEMVTKERTAREAAERELAELKNQLSQVSKNADLEKIEAEITELEKQRGKALLDGDVDKAAELAAQIRMKDEAVRISRQSDVPERIKEEMREELRWENAVKSLEDTYEVLKPGGEKYDQDIVDMVLLAQESYVTKLRMKPSEALVAAAEKVMGKINALGPKNDAPSAGLEAGKNPVQDRAKAQIDKNLDTLKKQPADLSDTGLDSDKAGQTGHIDVTKLSSEEFANLPESTKARLRGDII